MHVLIGLEFAVASVKNCAVLPKSYSIVFLLFEH